MKRCLQSANELKLMLSHLQQSTDRKSHTMKELYNEINRVNAQLEKIIIKGINQKDIHNL